MSLLGVDKVKERERERERKRERQLASGSAKPDFETS